MILSQGKINIPISQLICYIFIVYLTSINIYFEIILNISIFILFIWEVSIIKYDCSINNFFKKDMQVKDLQYYHTFLLINDSSISI